MTNNKQNYGKDNKQKGGEKDKEDTRLEIQCIIRKNRTDDQNSSRQKERRVLKHNRDIYYKRK